jgi:hypothetical protein
MKLKQLFHDKKEREGFIIELFLKTSLFLSNISAADSSSIGQEISRIVEKRKILLKSTGDE